MANDRNYSEEKQQLNERNNLSYTDDNLNNDNDYRTEAAAEIGAPILADRDDFDADDSSAGKGVGYTALVISILAMFFMPIFLGAVGIVVGFIARARGALTLGSWAIGVGAVAIILRLFFTPLTNFTFL